MSRRGLQRPTTPTFMNITHTLRCGIDKVFYSSMLNNFQFSRCLLSECIVREYFLFGFSTPLHGHLCNMHFVGGTWPIYPFYDECLHIYIINWHSKRCSWKICSNIDLNRNHADSISDILSIIVFIIRHELNILDKHLLNSSNSSSTLLDFPLSAWTIFLVCRSCLLNIRTKVNRNATISLSMVFKSSITSINIFNN